MAAALEAGFLVRAIVAIGAVREEQTAAVDQRGQAARARRSGGRGIRPRDRRRLSRPAFPASRPAARSHRRTSR